MNVDVLIPWRGGCLHREAALEWTTARYRSVLATSRVILGHCRNDQEFNRSAAILDAASHSSADVLVISDGDVFCDPRPAIDKAAEFGWSIPHTMIHRLSRASTEHVLKGETWRGLALSDDNRRDHRPYVGNETGTLFVIARDVLVDVPPDVRFVGWGQEDEAYRDALHTLVGRPWRGGDDLVHLWHPAQPRTSRIVGNKANLELARRYVRARRNPEKMRALVDESRLVAA